MPSRHVARMNTFPSTYTYTEYTIGRDRKADEGSRKNRTQKVPHTDKTNTPVQTTNPQRKDSPPTLPPSVQIQNFPIDVFPPTFEALFAQCTQYIARKTSGQWEPMMSKGLAAAPTRPTHKIDRHQPNFSSHPNRRSPPGLSVYAVVAEPRTPRLERVFQNNCLSPGLQCQIQVVGGRTENTCKYMHTLEHGCKHEDPSIQQQLLPSDYFRYAKSTRIFKCRLFQCPDRQP